MVKAPFQTFQVGCGSDQMKMRFSVDVVKRGHEYFVRTAYVTDIHFPRTVLSAELIDIQHGLQFAVQTGFDEVLV